MRLATKHAEKKTLIILKTIFIMLNVIGLIKLTIQYNIYF
jgi:hypothetical protein